MVSEGFNLFVIFMLGSIKQCNLFTYLYCKLKKLVVSINLNLIKTKEVSHPDQLNLNIEGPPF